MTAVAFGEEIAFKVGLPGRHIVQNMLGVLGAARLLGADLAKVAHALADLPAPDGRGKRHECKVGAGTFTLIDESYNANPASVEAALDLLAALEPAGEGRRIAVLGDMLELGAHSARLHRDLAEPVRRAGLDHLYLCGQEMAALAETLGDEGFVMRHFDTVDTLAGVLADEIGAGDAVMVKSSNGMGLSRLVAMFRDAGALAGA